MGERGHSVIGISPLLLAGGLASLLAGCVGAPEPPPGQVEQSTAALGEPSGDYPDYDERVVLYATNRARANPSQEGWPSYPAQPPLQWNEQLNESARAHSIDMRDTPCFQHNSCDNTDVFTRITTYYTTSYSEIGENISAGVPDGVTAVHNWLYEIGAAAGETGHRDNIFSKDFTLMGVGFAVGGTQYQNYWTQDFIGTPVTLPALSDGIHFPVTAATGKSLTFGATWYDAAGRPPAAISAVIDGHCHTLALTRGGDGLAAYETSATLADGCHPYYFLATVGSTTSIYPSTGSLQAGYGSTGASCALFVTTQAASDCGGASPTNPSPPPVDMGAHDAATTRPPSGAVDMAQSISHGGADAGGGILLPPDPTQRGNGGCSLYGGGDGAANAAPLALLAFVFALLCYRRRLQ